MLLLFSDTLPARRPNPDADLSLFQKRDQYFGTTVTSCSLIAVQQLW